MQEYRVPKETVRTEIKVKNSRFITTAARTGSVEEAQSFIESIRNEMPDATHHVYAYKIGFGASVTEGRGDDGEPSGTSGPPILSILRGSDLGDITIVVARWFGGTKLGTGGLVSAYSESAKSALEQLKTELKVDLKKIELTVPYPLFEQVNRILDGYDVREKNDAFSADVTIQCKLPSHQVERLRGDLRNLMNGNDGLRELEA
jgi:uncharacterized YigZ family protein